ncbi:Halomucin [Bienertia sinuspersici]
MNKGGAFDNVTVRFWHGGKFKHVATGELIYIGGQGKTYEVDPDEFSYFDFIDLAKKCANYGVIEGLYYLLPGQGLLEGLRKVVDDGVVPEMVDLAVKYRTIEMYVLHEKLEPNYIISPEPLSIIQSDQQLPLLNANNPPKPKKLTPKRGPPAHVKPIAHPLDSSPKTNLATPSIPKVPCSTFTGTTNPKNPSPVSQLNLTQNTQNDVLDHNNDFLANYEWEDPRPESPIRYDDLIDYSSEDSEDSLYVPNSGSVDGDDGTDFDGDDDTDFDVEGDEETEAGGGEDHSDEETEAGGGEDHSDELQETDNSDEEYAVAKQRVRSCNSKLVQIAKQLEREACEGKLTSQKSVTKQPVATELSQPEGGYASDYYNSEDDIETPPDSGDELETGRRSSRGVLVGPETDFTSFEWKVGQRFATRDDFKAAVAKYAIMQGRDVFVSISNNRRRQELGVRCVEGCPFYLYSSWHSSKASFIVKRVDNVHQCHRNMKRNRQLKSTWVAKEMLEVFKARPHWPAKDIIEAIRRAYKMVVKKGFAYKVKYYAHKMLHGSMQDHYRKVGRYIEALKVSSPRSVLDLVVDTSKQTSPPIFQRLFTCFEGLRKGWLEGCRRVICVDAAFLKTFLGGQILSAVGRDANEQMFPIAWAAVEGENINSWEWFFKHLQSCLELGDGSGLAIISDEHQVI